jgi:YidC/Oxa1 family membrane protein insertase
VHPMKELFSAILYEPIFNGFVALYNLIPDVGVVILIVTLIIRGVMYPLTKKSISSQKSMQDLQPKMEDLKKKHKDNQQLLAQETMKLYKEHKVNPIGSCLPILLQLPIFLALFYVLQNGLANESFDLLYSFVAHPGSINPIGFGIVNLAEPNVFLAILAALAQYWQAKTMQSKRPPKVAGEGGKDESMSAMMNKQMLYFMPFITLVIGMTFPGGLALYWMLSTLSMAIQQEYIFRKKKPTDGGVIEGTIVE